MLLGVFAMARGQHVVSKAYSLDDISSRVSPAATYADAGRDVAESLAILPRLRQIPLPGQPGTVGNPPHAPDRARDPPSAFTRTETHVR